MLEADGQQYGVSRLVAFSDGVFGFAITLLITTIPFSFEGLTPSASNEQFAQQLLSLLPNFYAYAFSFYEERQRSRIQTTIDAPGQVTIIAERERQIIGLLSFSNGERKRIAHQGEFGMTVAREWRNQGVGRALLSALLLWVQQNPLIEKVCLTVFANNPRAIALYRALGFTEEGRQIKQVKIGPDVYIDLIHMARFVNL